MKLLEQIEQDFIASFKMGDKVKTETLKMIKSDITYEKVKTGEDLTDEAVLEVITRAAKKRKEAVDEYTKANREDLAKIEAIVLEIINKYLPEQMSEVEIEKYIEDKLDSFGEVTKKEFGRVMGELMKELKGKADGKLVKDILNKKID